MEQTSPTSSSLLSDTDFGCPKPYSEDEDCRDAAGEEIKIGVESLTLNAATEETSRVSPTDSAPSDTDTDESEQDSDPLKEKITVPLYLFVDAISHSATPDGVVAEPKSPNSTVAETASLTSSPASESTPPHGRASLKSPQRPEGGSTSSPTRGARPLQGILKRVSGDDINPADPAEGPASGPATPKKASLGEHARFTEEPGSLEDDGPVIAPTSPRLRRLSTSSNKSGRSVHFLNAIEIRDDPSALPTFYSETQYRTTRRNEREERRRRSRSPSHR